MCHWRYVIESHGLHAVCFRMHTISNSSKLQTRVYEKIRFPRVRRAQTNGEDLRDRWHSALERSIEGEEIDPNTLLIKVS